MFLCCPVHIRKERERERKKLNNDNSYLNIRVLLNLLYTTAKMRNRIRGVPRKRGEGRGLRPQVERGHGGFTLAGDRRTVAGRSRGTGTGGGRAMNGSYGAFKERTAHRSLQQELLGLFLRSSAPGLTTFLLQLS